MKKLLATIVVGAVMASAVSGAMQARRETPGVSQAAGEASGVSPDGSGATFELTYRGLNVPDDPMSYRSYWGFGGEKDPNTRFIAAVKNRVKQYDCVINNQLPEAMQWSVVELQDGKPVALYFDADGNGELSDNERFPRVAPSRPNFGYECAFITSDFMTRTEDQKEAPFRIMLIGSKNASGPMSYMWSPCCILEGKATLNGDACVRAIGKPVLAAATQSSTRNLAQTLSCKLPISWLMIELERTVRRERLRSILRWTGVT